MAESLRDKARRKAEEKEQQSKSVGGYIKLPDGIEYYEPKKGKADIDVVVYKVAAKHNPAAQPGELWYERTFYTHSNIGAEKGKKYICPLKTFKRRCPVCEALVQLKKDGWEKNKALISDIKPKERQLFNIDTGKTTKVLESSYHTFGKLIEKEFREAENEDWAGFAGLTKGFTLRIRFDDSELKNTKGEPAFVEPGRIDFIPRDDYEEAILTEMVDLDACLVELDYDTLNKIFLEIDGEEGAGAGAQKEETNREEEAPTRQRRAARQDQGQEQDPPPPPPPATPARATRQAAPSAQQDQEQEQAPPQSRTRTTRTVVQDPPLPPPDAPATTRATRGAAAPKASDEDCPGVKDGGSPGEFAKDCDVIAHCPDCDIWEKCRDAADVLVATRKR